MLLRLFLLIAILPALELYLLLQVGAALGATPTLLLILATGLLGATLARREGLGVLQQLQRDLARGLPPGDRLVEGLLVLVGGLLLLTPGILTDAIGMLLMIGPVRRALAPRIAVALASRVHLQAVGPGVRPDAGGAFGSARDVPPHRPRAAERRPDHPFANPFDDLP